MHFSNIPGYFQAFFGCVTAVQVVINEVTVHDDIFNFRKLVSELLGVPSHHVQC
jgi:hypothetical protein